VEESRKRHLERLKQRSLDLSVGEGAPKPGFRADTGRWPSSLQEMAPPSCRGLSCTLRELHNDPWGHPYGLAITPERIRVVSAGPSGQLGDGDDLDLVVWQQ
jgi:hypothetical protein